MAARSKAAPEALNSIDRGPQLLTEDRVGMHAPVEENQVTPSEHALQGARRQELTAVAPVPKAGAGGEVIGARSKWATISASPEQPSSQAPAKRGKSWSTREKGATCPSVTATHML